MIKKILLITAFSLTGAVMAIGPALASSSTSSSARLSRSDEAFLSEMPDIEFPGPAQMRDDDGDGIADGDSARGSIADPFEPQTAKPNTKYIYKPSSTSTLRRTIQDDRIEDGYVQGLMQQRGPQ